MTTTSLGRRAQISVLTVSIVAGIVAAGAARHALDRRFQALEAATRVATVSRVVAIDDLLPGDRLSVDTVALRDIPESGAVSDSVMPEDFDRYADAVVLGTIRAGEQILRSAVRVDANTPLAARLQDGRRAVTIAVDDVSSQAGMVQPGDRVDILATLDLPRGRATIPLLRAVSILAVGQRAARGSSAPGMPNDYDDDLQATSNERFSTITLDVDEPAAIRLIAARQSSALSVTLRHDVAVDARQTLAPLTNEVQVVLGLARPTPVRMPRIVPVLNGSRPATDATTHVIDSVQMPDGDSEFLP